MGDKSEDEEDDGSNEKDSPPTLQRADEDSDTQNSKEDDQSNEADESDGEEEPAKTIQLDGEPEDEVEEAKIIEVNEEEKKDIEEKAEDEVEEAKTIEVNEEEKKDIEEKAEDLSWLEDDEPKTPVDTESEEEKKKQRWKIEEKVPEIQQKHESDVVQIQNILGKEIDFEDFEFEKHIIGPVEKLLTHVNERPDVGTEVKATVELIKRISQGFNKLEKKKNEMQDEFERTVAGLRDNIQKLEEMQRKEVELEQLHQDMRQILNILTAQENPFIDSEKMTEDIQNATDNGTPTNPNNKTPTNPNDKTASSQSYEINETEHKKYGSNPELHEIINDFASYVQDELNTSFLIVVNYLENEDWIETKIKELLVSNYHQIIEDENVNGQVKTIDADGKVSYSSLDINRKQMSRIFSFVDDITDFLDKPEGHDGG